MRQHFRIAMLVFAVLWVTGCVENSKPAPNRGTSAGAVQPLASPAPAAPQASPPATAAGGAAAVVPAAPLQPATPVAPPSSPQPAPPVVAAQASIQLSTGVALPQTGPEGTMMMFSVDYEFTQGTPDSQGYVWVIERTHGTATRQQVRLTTKGTLQTPIQRWRPEDGPFNSHLEDGKGNRVSESIEMR